MRKQHSLSADGSMSWEEVECLGGCANAPLVQIGSDYFEDLDKDSFEKLISDVETDKSPVPGSRIGRFSSEPSNMTKNIAEKNRQVRTLPLKDIGAEICLKRKTKYFQIFMGFKIAL